MDGDGERIRDDISNDGWVDAANDYITATNYLNEESFLRVQEYDPIVVDLVVNAGIWIKGAGRAIGQSTVLKTLCVDTSVETDSHWLTELCQGLSHNQSIERFKWIICERDPLVDTFQMLHPFFHNSGKLQNIEITNFHESQSFLSLVSALTRCTFSRLKRIMIDWRRQIPDDQVAALFDSLRENHTHLRDFTFHRHYFERMGSVALASWLKNPSCAVCSLNLTGTTIDESCFAVISNGLISSNTLKRLHLSENQSFSAISSCILSGVLFHPTCCLKKLYLRECLIGDEVISYLGGALLANKSLVFLELSFNQFITWEGWKEFTKFLSNPQSTLKELFLYGCDIDDEGAKVIATGLAGNSSLEMLDMNANNRITSIGLCAFFDTLFENKHSAMLELQFRENYVAIEGLAFEEWGVLSRAICDKTTIDSTFSSNHTFCNFELFDWPDEYETTWEEIDALLSMNSNPDKSKVASEKILKCHFSGGTTGIHALVCMHETVLPYAIEWMGRYMHGYSAMFDFVKSFPNLFNVSCGQVKEWKKRKL